MREHSPDCIGSISGQVQKLIWYSMNKGYCFWLHNAFLRKLHCKKGSTIYQIDYRSVSKIACVNLLFTLDLTCPARFLWLWPGTLRSQKWYDRIAFQNALLLMWIGCSAHCFGTKSRYDSLGVKGWFLLSNRHKYAAYRSGTVWTVQLRNRSVQFDFPEYHSHCIRSDIQTGPKINPVDCEHSPRMLLGIYGRHRHCGLKRHNLSHLWLLTMVINVWKKLDRWGLNRETGIECSLW